MNELYNYINYVKYENDDLRLFKMCNLIIV